ncbi:MAG: DUF192 domain-containing protein [Beijerinckiaceae bacterium]|nr:DUF192 domain-containing protein [Beijerinckiaceae bacterium]
MRLSSFRPFIARSRVTLAWGGALLALLAVVQLPPVSPALSQAALSTPPQQLERLTITTASGEHNFQIEVARTDEQRARGLMFRRFMPEDRGMLFDFKIEQPVMMWMRNTYIPLDMIFISRDGRVINVAEDTEPLSERTIASAAPAFAVLEVNAGVARKIGLKAGDRISHAMFKR